MNINFQDPEIIIPVGVILVCVAALVWAVGRLFKKSESLDLTLEGLPSTGNELFDQTPPPPYPDFAAPPPPVQTPRPAVPSREGGTPPPGVSKEMVERLDTMSQRLTDMQGVLQRQAGSAPAGTPLTPETIDKLLKIVGNVTQQVDLLQRSLGVAPSTPVPAAAPTLGAPRPASTPPPASPPPAAAPKPGITAEPSGKGNVGLLGGALSKFSKPPAKSPGTDKPPTPFQIEK